jgi:hypothetical protein
MQHFLADNWLSILSILIGIVVAYLFYRLQKRDSVSAAVERKKRATAELLDVVETYVINKQRLSEAVIDNLIHASERDHAVALRPSCTATTLLQDVALRLQRSRHLDIPQKSEYSEKLEQLIQGIRNNRTPARIDELDAEIDSTVSALLNLVPSERKSEAQIAFESLAGLLKRRRAGQSKEITEADSPAYFFALATVIGFIATMATALIGSGLTDSLRFSQLMASMERHLPVVGALLAAVVALAAIRTTLRTKKRITEIAGPRERTVA